MKNIDLLNTILTKSSAQNNGAANSVRTVCVFDLDSTLFNVAPRTEQILKEFSELEKQTDLSKIKVNAKDWGLKEILIREGYDFSKDAHQNINLHKKLISFWTEKFFTNRYLHFDTPYLGAVEFTQILFKNKIEIHYLTGRDVHRMGVGTREVLLKWGFPILSEKNLHLKPHKDMDDHKFKLDWVVDFKNAMQHSAQHSKIYFFENEPVNINAIGEALPELEIVYLNTTHSRKENVRVPVIEIENFSLEKSH
jgi:hypothetical protein